MMVDRPGVYLHVEFGVAWPPKRPGRHGQITYLSKSLQQQHNSIPAIQHANDTNFYSHPQRRRRSHNPRDHAPQNTHTAIVANRPYNVAGPGTRQHPHPHYEPYYYYASRDYNQFRHPQPLQPSQTLPTFAQHNYGAHNLVHQQSGAGFERGRSAPPLGSDSPWDVEPEPMTATALPRQSQQLANSTSQLQRSDLPAHQYRLGADGMPWSPSPFPQGSTDPSSSSAVASIHAHSSIHSVPPISAASSESGHPRSLELGRPVVQIQPPDDRQRTAVREIQSLASAMMTVDNGFEDQWWYQGNRCLNVTGDQISTNNPRSAHDDSRLGWAIARAEGRYAVDSPASLHRSQTSSSSWANHVSPMSDGVSPVSDFHPGVRRSRTTPSNELRMSI